MSRLRPRTLLVGVSIGVAVTAGALVFAGRYHYDSSAREEYEAPSRWAVESDGPSRKRPTVWNDSAGSSRE